MQIRFREEEQEEGQDRRTAWENTKRGIVMKLVLVVGVVMIVGAAVPREQAIPAVQSLFRQASSDIRGGSRAVKSDFPEVVGISFNRKVLKDGGQKTELVVDRCTGVRIERVQYDSGIKEERILTAGHCCGHDTSKHKIWTGIQMEPLTPANGISVTVRYLYKNYSWPAPHDNNSPVNDLCVIGVEEKMEKVAYPHLADKEPVKKTEKVVIAGFGWTGDNNKNTDYFLYKAEVHRTECATALSGVANGNAVKPDVICAQEKRTGRPNQNGCSGDSGGPMFSATRDANGKYTLYGILSDGKRSCRDGPAWYSRLSNMKYTRFALHPFTYGEEIDEPSSHSHF